MAVWREPVKLTLFCPRGAIQTCHLRGANNFRKVYYYGDKSFQPVSARECVQKGALIRGEARVSDIYRWDGLTSGFEQLVAELYREYVKPFAHRVTTDVMGDVIEKRFSKVSRNLDYEIQAELKAQDIICHCEHP